MEKEQKALEEILHNCRILHDAGIQLRENRFKDIHEFYSYKKDFDFTDAVDIAKYYIYKYSLKFRFALENLKFKFITDGLEDSMKDIETFMGQNQDYSGPAKNAINEISQTNKVYSSILLRNID